MWNRLFSDPDEQQPEFAFLDHVRGKGNSSPTRTPAGSDQLAQTHELMDTLLKSMISSSGFQTPGRARQKTRTDGEESKSRGEAS